MSQPAGHSGLTLPWWSLAYAILTTAALVLLAWGLVLVQAIGFGVAHAFDLGPVTAPDADRYALALAVAVAVNLGGSLGLSRLWLSAVEPAWPPAVAALPVVVVSGAVSAAAMLAVLGIDPALLLSLL
jgi:hypothetical protein